MAFGGADAQRLLSQQAALGDVRPGDVALGILAAALVLGGTTVAVLTSTTTPLAEQPSILAPGEIAVAVRPVELPEAKAADVSSAPRRDATGVGDPRLAPASVPSRPPDAPLPPTAGSLPEHPIGGIKGLPRLSTPRAPLKGVRDNQGAARSGFGPGGPAVAPGPADPASSPDDPYAYVDPAAEDPSASPGSGVVTKDKGSGDALAARAVAAYRQRLQRWLSVRFYLSGTGLPKQTLLRARIKAEIEIGKDRKVVGYAIEPGGHPELEAAARRALQAALGKPVPEPPAHYPGPLQRRISVTFVCTEETCD